MAIFSSSVARAAPMVVLALLFSASIAEPAPGASGVAAEFERVRRMRGAADTARGAIYLRPPSTLAIHVESPVRQRIVSTPAELTIYYPEQAQAHVIRAEAQGPPTLMWALVYSNRVPEHLEASGYRLGGYSENGDTVEYRWIGADEDAGTALPAVVTTRFAHGRLVELAAVDSEGRRRSRTLLSDHVRKGGFDFPTRVEETGEGISPSEIWTFASVRWDDALQDSLFSLTIPDSVHVKESGRDAQ